jgi:hypothetical protein
MTWKERNYQYTPEERERKNKIAKLRYYEKTAASRALKEAFKKAIEETKAKLSTPKLEYGWIGVIGARKIYNSLAYTRGKCIANIIATKRGTWRTIKKKFQITIVKVKIEVE